MEREKKKNYLSHRGKNKGLSGVVSVRTNAHVDLVRRGVLAVGFSETEDWVGRTLLDVRPETVCEKRRTCAG